jgi:hypothetical protein
VPVKAFFEITSLATWHFCGNMKRHSRPLCNANRDFRPLLGGQPAEKGEIGARLEICSEHIGRQAVIYRAAPVGFGDSAALVIGNRNERGTWETSDYIWKTGQVQPSVHRGDEWHAKPTQQRQV